MKITKELLISKRACSEQVELFAKTFPNGTTVTKKACLLACKVGLDFGWASSYLLTPSQKEAYKEIEGPAREAYNKIEGPALIAYYKIQRPAYKAYLEIQGPAWEAYEEIQGKALKAYVEIQGKAWEAYKEIKEQEWEAYEEKRAIAFYNACKVK